MEQGERKLPHIKGDNEGRAPKEEHRQGPCLGSFPKGFLEEVAAELGTEELGWGMTSASLWKTLKDGFVLMQKGLNSMLCFFVICISRESGSGRARGGGFWAFLTELRGWAVLLDYAGVGVTGARMREKGGPSAFQIRRENEHFSSY